MILITHRDDLKDHLKHLVLTTQGQLRVKNPPPTNRKVRDSMAAATGRLAALEEVLLLIKAWEENDERMALQDDPNRTE